MLRSVMHMPLITALIAIVWMVGVNHCAFEQLVSIHDGSTSECPTHQENSPDSHSEGRACGQQSAGSAEVRTAEPAVVFINAFAAAILQPTEVVQNFVSDHSTINLVSVVDSRPLFSLSIASNAPPIRHA